MRALRLARGLAIGLSLTVLNLVGSAVTLFAFGGLSGWSGMQFIGLFGALEVGLGVAFLFAPNAWRLPVVAVERAGETPLAADEMLIPHWPALAKVLGGASLITASAWSEGVTPAVIGLLPASLGLALGTMGLSIGAARLGAAHPGGDVLQFVLKRPGRRATEFPPASISSLVVQAVLNVLTFPAVKLLNPGELFRPEFAPSARLVAWTAGGGALLLCAGIACWWDRLAVSAASGTAPGSRAAGHETGKG